MKRVAVARLWFEGNSFCPRLTTLADFQAREWHDAASAEAFYRGSGTEMGALCAWKTQHAQTIQTDILRCAAAPPGGPLAAGVFSLIVDDIVEGLQILAQPPDGVYLSLHGAMVAQDCANPDLELVKRVRGAVGPDCPIAISVDLHANLDPALAELVQIIVGYKTYPHIDMDATATRTLQLLHATMAGHITPVSSIVSAQMILPSHKMTTNAEPMAGLEKLAAQLVQSGEALDASPLGGFAYADSAHTSAGVAICLDARRHADLNTARQYAARLGAQLVVEMQRRQQAFIPQLPTAALGLNQALNYLSQYPQGCVAVLDPADNPLSGGAGDTTGLLQTLLDLQLDLPTVFAFFYDPELVTQASSVGVGGQFTAQLGGRFTSAYGTTVSLVVQVELLTDGHFINDGPMEQGLACNIGPSVVLRSVRQPDLRIIVSSSCQSPNDMAWCRLHQIDLSRVRLFCVKAKNHFRAAFAPQLLAIIDVDAPGPAMLNFSALPYEHIQHDFLSRQFFCD